MKKCILIVSVLIATTSLLAARVPGEQETDSIERAILVVLNNVRNNPKSFLPYIDRYRAQVKSFTKDVKALDVAVKEIKARLQKQSPLPALHLQGALYMAARDHAKDITEHAVVGHIGSDASDPLLRVKRYGQMGSLGEAITYGHMTPELIIAAFLVDEGTPGRGHRENLLSPTYLMVGIAVGIHPTYGRSCVIVLGNP